VRGEGRGQRAWAGEEEGRAMRGEGRGEGRGRAGVGDIQCNKVCKRIQLSRQSTGKQIPR
jgi:hypothetical protein